MDLSNKYGTLEVQRQLLLLLKQFHDFCLSNDIKYSLDWGSLLGAIRHKGFIPWDDDLDIMVDRRNCEKIRKAIRQSSLFTIEREKRALWIEKVRMLNSVNIGNYPPTLDIFIIDNAPDSILSRKIRLFLLLFMQGMMKQHPNFHKGNIGYRLATICTYLIGRMIPASIKIKWYDQLMQKTNNKKTKKKASYNTAFEDLGKLYDNDVLTDVMLAPFEDTEVYVTKSFHQCLIDKFGPDYMIPPSDDKRVPIHI